ncbi:MAG: hypothetical protein MHM6MM_003512 [Cercozoa sp. M6MM]
MSQLRQEYDVAAAKQRLDSLGVKREGAAEMTSLPELSEAAVLDNLRRRFETQQVYTAMGSVMVAVNPYQVIRGLYTAERLSACSQHARGVRNKQGAMPHVFRTGAEVHMARANGHSQSVIVSGESGAGKTESAKFLLRFLTKISSSADKKKKGVAKRLVATNPLFEAFGNARTAMNDNSSRFGKFIRLLYSKQGSICGAKVDTYLLEKSRVSIQSSGERNFHIFHQLLCGLEGVEPDLAQTLHMSGRSCTDFRTLCSAAETVVAGTGGNTGRKVKIQALTREEMARQDSIDATDFAATHSALKDDLRMSTDELRGLYAVLAAILHLSNVQFERHAEGARIKNDDSVKKSADLFGVQRAALKKRLLSRTISTRDGEITKPLSLEECQRNRDAMAKDIYARLFNHLVSRVNEILAPKEKESDNFVGILDVFGFENFATNSFEQLCINYANEELQALFNAHVIRNEQDEYLREGVLWRAIAVPDNQAVCTLLNDARFGLFALIEAAITAPGGNADLFLRNAQKRHGEKRLKKSKKSKKHSKSRSKHEDDEVLSIAPGELEDDENAPVFRVLPRGRFVISHFAGDVTYDASDFLHKDADAVHEDTPQLLSQSRAPLLNRLYPQEATSAASGNRRKKKSKTIGRVFRTQVAALVEMLGKTRAHFLRCIKPNASKSSSLFEVDYVRRQLRANGIVEALTVMKLGYPSRLPLTELQHSLRLALNESERLRKLAPRHAVPALLAAFDIDASQCEVGTSKVFFRAGAAATAIEQVRTWGNRPFTTEMKVRIRRHLAKQRWRLAIGTVHSAIVLHRAIRRQRALLKLRKTVRVACKVLKVRALARDAKRRICERKGVEYNATEQEQQVASFANELGVQGTAHARTLTDEQRIWHQFVFESVIGTRVVKHMKRGRPHFRLLQISTDGTRLQWTSGSISIQHITHFRRGKNTSALRKAVSAPSENCVTFYVVSRKTLDLEFADSEILDRWLNGFQRLVHYNALAETEQGRMELKSLGILPGFFNAILQDAEANGTAPQVSDTPPRSARTQNADNDDEKQQEQEFLDYRSVIGDRTWVRNGRNDISKPMPAAHNAYDLPPPAGSSDDSTERARRKRGLFSRWFGK